MHANITLGPGGHGSVKLDGHDISNGVRGFTLNAAVGQITELGLDLVLFTASTVSGEVELVIPASTRDLLERLGWTPPKTP
ncbi:hypothetical protein [Micromonospora sp. NPDC005113]